MLWWLVSACALLAPEPSSVVKLGQVDVIKLPAWTVDASSLDTECGGLLQYCVRELCVVRSNDPEPTVGNLVFSLHQRQGHYNRRERIELGPKQEAKIAATFPEAKMLGGETTGGCEIEHTGTRILCTVHNSGAQAHEVELVARLTDREGAPSAEQRRVVAIGAGQTESVPFLFDKLNAAGTCAIEGQ